MDDGGAVAAAQRLSVAVAGAAAALAPELTTLGHEVTRVAGAELDVTPVSRWLADSYRLYRALRGSAYDVVVFSGHDAYCAARARQLGLDLAGTAIVAWLPERPPPRGFLAKADVGTLVTERLVVELADAVVRGDAPRWAGALRRPAPRPPVPEPTQLVSVVVAFHERTAYLEQCLEGLALQTCGSLEVVVADDGSASGEAKRLLRDVASRTWPWPLRVLDLPREGVAAARNRGAEAAAGEEVVFVDDDDVPFPELVEVLARGRAASGAEVVAAATRVFAGDGPPEPRAGDKVTIPFGNAGELGLLGNHFGPATCLWSRARFLELGGFRDVHFEDWELLARASLAGVRIAAAPEPLLWQRLTPGSRFAGTRAGRVEARLPIAELYAERLPEELRLLPLLVAGAYGELDRREREAPAEPPTLGGRVLHRIRGAR